MVVTKVKKKKLSIRSPDRRRPSQACMRGTMARPGLGHSGAGSRGEAAFGKKKMRWAAALLVLAGVCMMMAAGVVVDCAATAREAAKVACGVSDLNDLNAGDEYSTAGSAKVRVALVAKRAFAHDWRPAVLRPRVCGQGRHASP